MSTWRRKALEFFPDLRNELEQPDATPMSLFFELLARVREAHNRNDNTELRRIHSYASWCAREDAKALWSAAFVGFYEHLVDHPITRDAIAEWVPTDIFEEAIPLFAARMSDSALQELIKDYNRKNRTKLSRARN